MAFGKKYMGKKAEYIYIYCVVAAELGFQNLFLITVFNPSKVLTSQMMPSKLFYLSYHMSVLVTWGESSLGEQLSHSYG